MQLLKTTSGNKSLGFFIFFVFILIYILETQTSKITIQRYGSFGSVQVDWSIQRGKPPAAFDSFILSGLISPSSGSVSMMHGQSLAYFEVKVLISADCYNLFFYLQGILLFL